MKRKKIFLMLLIFFICSVINFADNVKDIAKYLETTMKNKGELNFVLKYEKSDNSISTYTEDGKFIYKNISLSGSDTLEYSNGVQVKISEKNGKLKPFIDANISNGEAIIRAEYILKKPIDLKKIAKNGINMNLIENVELDNIISAKSQIQILSQIKSTTELKNRISTTKIYSMSGELLRYTVYKYGKTFTEGVVEEYSPNGELLTINEVKDGVLNGKAKFYEGSKLKGIAHYKNNILDGEALEYNEKGEVINRWYYKNGVEIKELKYWQETKEEELIWMQEMIKQ